MNAIDGDFLHASTCEYMRACALYETETEYNVQLIETTNKLLMHMSGIRIFHASRLLHCNTVEPLIKDPPKKGQPLNNEHISGHQTYGCSVF